MHQVKERLNHLSLQLGTSKSVTLQQLLEGFFKVSSRSRQAVNQVRILCKLTWTSYHRTCRPLFQGSKLAAMLLYLLLVYDMPVLTGGAGGQDLRALPAVLPTHC